MGGGRRRREPSRLLPAHEYTRPPQRRPLLYELYTRRRFEEFRAASVAALGICVRRGAAAPSSYEPAWDSENSRTADSLRMYGQAHEHFERRGHIVCPLQEGLHHLGAALEACREDAGAALEAFEDRRHGSTTLSPPPDSLTARLKLRDPHTQPTSWARAPGPASTRR